MSTLHHLADLFDADELLALARHDMTQERLQAALEKLKCCLAMPVPPADALPLAARLYATLGLPLRSRALLRQYLALQPEAVNERLELGRSHFDDAEPDAAQAFWEAVLERHPTHPPALYYSALLQARQGKPMAARRHLDVLLHSAAADNLYVGRARQLLASFDGAQQDAAPRAHEAGPGDTWQ